MNLLILDRDGVINRDSDDYVKSAEEWIPISGSIAAIAQLSQAGFTVVVATNQSGIARGYFDLEALEAMHAKLNDLVAAAGGELSGIFYCPHGPDDGCLCRKPAAGLLDAIASELAADLSCATVVGDSLRDLQAGLLRDCRVVLVRTGKGTKTELLLAEQAEVKLQTAPVFDDLAAVAEFLLAESSPNP